MTETSLPGLPAIIAELQSRGARVEPGIGGRRSGAGPADAGMVLVDGAPVTFPFDAEYVQRSPFVMRETDQGWALFRDGQRMAAVEVPERPRFYDLETSDGVPYHKIALLHLDSLASTVVQTCAYWGTADQCRFCAIELSLQAQETIAVKRPQQLAEVAVAARDLDGAVDVTLTTGSSRGRDKGALYVGRCAQAVKEASGLPVQAQFEPPSDLDVLRDVKDHGVDVVGMHVESFDPEVLALVAPPKAATGIEGYFRAWERAVDIFGEGQVSTYVILGMGEDPELTAEACRRAVDIGVYPFIVPLRPVAGSLMADWLPPEPAYVSSLYQQVVPRLVQRGLTSGGVQAGCARCQACSAMSMLEVPDNDPAARALPILDAH